MRLWAELPAEAQPAPSELAPDQGSDSGEGRCWWGRPHAHPQSPRHSEATPTASQHSRKRHPTQRASCLRARLQGGSSQGEHPRPPPRPPGPALSFAPRKGPHAHGHTTACHSRPSHEEAWRKDAVGSSLRNASRTQSSAGPSLLGDAQEEEPGRGGQTHQRAAPVGPAGQPDGGLPFGGSEKPPQTEGEGEAGQAGSPGCLWEALLISEGGQPSAPSSRTASDWVYRTKTRRGGGWAGRRGRGTKPPGQEGGRTPARAPTAKPCPGKADPGPCTSKW